MWWWLVATWLLVQAQASMDDGCIEGFVVHRDKIIRTEDSKNMGAKFLSELEVENRQECMSWCCDTQRCDVFIFEEKKPGSCYLFHCGPPHDFKCKFTSHANYSSAVLQNYADLQNADELEEEIRRTQHEHQLKSLRKPEPPSREYDYFVTNPPPPRLTDPPTTPSTTTTTTVRGSKCSRNQFECRSNDDCIAIYNVCDGIPQCPDGSDEAAEELGCPTVKTTLPPPPPPPPLVVGPSPRPAYVPHLPDFIRYQQQMLQEQQHAQQYPMLYPSQDGINKDWVNQLRHPQHQDASYDPAVSYGAPPNGYKLDAPPQSPVQYQWNNNYDPGIIYEQQQQQQHQQRQQSHEDPQSPHIFNHKPPNPGIRVQDDTEAQNAGYPSNQQLYPYDNQMHSWQGNNNPAPTQAPPAPTTSSAPPRPTQPPPCDPNEKHDKEVTPAKEKPAPVAAVVHQSAAPGGASRHPESKQSAPVGAEKVSKPDVDSHKAHAELDHHADQPPLAAHQQQQNNHVAIIDHVRRVKPVSDDFDGMSRPKIAIISLALGLSVTTVMIVLIASTCRLKVVKRRGGRRGGRDSGADDYLVNGMYL